LNFSNKTRWWIRECYFSKEEIPRLSKQVTSLVKMQMVQDKN